MKYKNFKQSTKEIAENYNEFKTISFNEPISSQFKNEVLMITGASGFLALHLIKELVELKNTKKIICLVRNKEKFNKNKLYFNIDFSEEKIVFLVKDLIDLSLEDLSEVNRVVHNAAEIHALKSFDQLKKSNVDITVHLYKLTTIAKIPISLISTLSVWVSSNKVGYHQEEKIKPVSDHYLYGGYAQTKWLTEHLAPPNTQIFRLGLLTGSSLSGIFPEKDFFSNVIKVLKEINAYPSNYKNAWVDMSPVNKVAKIIAQNMDKNGIINIANKKSCSLKTIFEKLNLKAISEIEFKEKLNNYPAMTKILIENACFKNNINKHYFNVDLFQSTDHYWEGSFLIKENNSKLLKTYIEKIR